MNTQRHSRGSAGVGVWLELGVLSSSIFRNFTKLNSDFVHVREPTSPPACCVRVTRSHDATVHGKSPRWSRLMHVLLDDRLDLVRRRWHGQKEPTLGRSQRCVSKGPSRRRLMPYCQQPPEKPERKQRLSIRVAGYRGSTAWPFWLGCVRHCEKKCAVELGAWRGRMRVAQKVAQ